MICILAMNTYLYSNCLSRIASYVSGCSCKSTEAPGRREAPDTWSFNHTAWYDASSSAVLLDAILSIPFTCSSPTIASTVLFLSCSLVSGSCLRKEQHSRIDLSKNLSRDSIKTGWIRGIKAKMTMRGIETIKSSTDCSTSHKPTALKNSVPRERLATRRQRSQHTLYQDKSASTHSHHVSTMQSLLGLTS